MKKGAKVRYTGIAYHSLTRGNIYDVLGSVDQGSVLIEDNHGNRTHYGIYDNTNIPMFIDVTAEIRNEVINEILG